MSYLPAILIIHFRNSPHTLRLLDSLIDAHQHIPFHTYIASIQSQSTEIFNSHALKPNLINLNDNLGFSWANNLLLKQAIQDKHHQFILLNNDTTVDSLFLAPLIPDLNKPSIGLVSPKIYFSPHHEYHNSDYQENELGKVIWYAGGIIDWSNVYAYHRGVDEVDHGQYSHVEPTDFATGCCLAISLDTINKIGFLDEKYFLYFEDVDWSIKAAKMNLTTLYDPKSIVYHLNAGSTGGSGSSLHQYYQARNRLYFGLKYAPSHSKLHLLKNGLLSVINPTSRPITQATKDALLARMGVNHNF